ncbi:hypothetical protein B0H67DRAFT_136969 [Lasiosphaeris hirsuta]|uniref:Uncharacterized protein n=1 Tax=Lasiosphaeris hirsuta TaxID=260670 RepID=A0AA40B168_9PEZI|nr:hypothetical protein B0H67DRAFT_136969 [Lasiosphaeris hirsuta]
MAPVGCRCGSASGSANPPRSLSNSCREEAKFWQSHNCGQDRAMESGDGLVVLRARISWACNSYLGVAQRHYLAKARRRKECFYRVARICSSERDEKREF